MKRRLSFEELVDDPEHVYKVLRREDQHHVFGAPDAVLFDDLLKEILLKLPFEEVGRLAKTDAFYHTPPGIDLRLRLEQAVTERDFRGPFTRELYRMVKNFITYLREKKAHEVTSKAVEEWTQHYAREYEEAVSAELRSAILRRARAESEAIRLQYHRRLAWKRAYQMFSSVSVLFMEFYNRACPPLVVSVNLGAVTPWVARRERPAGLV